MTATDLSEVLGNLRCNVSRNTRGRCRYTPQVAELSWDDDLDKSFPHSVYRYDYVLAADVVYHHDFLVTMRHFCQPGTTLIWASNTRFDSDLVFVESFKKTFNNTLLLDNGEVKIYSATTRDESALETSNETKGDARKGVDEDETDEMASCKNETNEGTEQKFVAQVQEYETKDAQCREEQATGYVDVENQEDGNLNNIEDNLDTEDSEGEDGCCEMDTVSLEQKSGQ